MDEVASPCKTCGQTHLYQVEEVHGWFHRVEELEAENKRLQSVHDRHESNHLHIVQRAQAELAALQEQADALAEALRKRLRLSSRQEAEAVLAYYRKFKEGKPIEAGKFPFEFFLFPVER